MPKEPISVTLDESNILWLRGRTAAAGARSLSETLDRLITDARTSGRMADAGIRSVAGTIDIAPSDPLLETADTAVRTLFNRSTRRPLAVRERSPSGHGRQRGPRKGHKHG